MKSITLEEVNKAVQSLIDTRSDKLLYAKIVETATMLTNANFGKLFLYHKDHLKKTYYSDERIKLNTLVTHKNFNKLLATNEILFVTNKHLHSWKMKYLPVEVKSLVIIPLPYDHQPMGFLFLYFSSDKKALTSTERELVTLYSNAAVLALTKAKLQEESQKSLEIRDRFIAMASHELRTPLTSIHGYIQLLYNRVKEQQTVESRWIKELFVESIRMTQLVKELLDVNRIKQGQFAFVFSEVPFQEVVTRALERHRVTNANHPFEFESKLSRNQTLVVGDFDKLVEMVSSLLGNAVKFSKPGEKICIFLKSSKDFVTLIVKDTGKGISKKDLSSVFNGFYKTENTIHLEGMGVGLLLAQYIVDNHRGRLKIKSKEEKGTTVIVTLPTMKTTT